ncbi:MAG TPA: mannose-1-phosphate guanylyltransferase/mannose-6-phosphate isomerase [Marinagarivorans sp.]
MSIVIPVVLSGGSGTRLWPKSRQYFPKQLHKLYGDYSLLQHTVKRVAADVAPIVVCNNEQRFMVADQLAEILPAKADIILEPMGRDTAPAVAIAALRAMQRDPEAIIAVFPADHLIKDLTVFNAAVDAAALLASEGKLVTFGVAPTRAETGYGYIKAAEKGGAASAVECFVEKPSADVAQQYVDSGDYYWNSGMFVFKASQVVAELEQYQPAIVAACKQALDASAQDLDFIRLDEQAFAQSPSISVDYALMEKTQKAWVLPLQNSGWNDIGSWDALWDVSDKDANGNALVGDVIAEGSSNCYVNTENRLVALVGVDNIAVIDTADAVLVINKDKAQQVKDVVAQLKADNRSEYTFHREVHRPWGCYDSIDNGERYQVKRITVKPGASLSLQMHHHRAEHWIVVSGTAVVQRGEEEMLVTENQSVYIPLGEKHRLTNPGKVLLELIEVQSGSYLGEDDIVRFEDVFGRK